MVHPGHRTLLEILNALKSLQLHICEYTALKFNTSIHSTFSRCQCHIVLTKIRFGYFGKSVVFMMSFRRRVHQLTDRLVRVHIDLRNVGLVIHNELDKIYCIFNSKMQWVKWLTKMFRILNNPNIGQDSKKLIQERYCSLRTPTNTILETSYQTHRYQQPHYPY